MSLSVVTTAGFTKSSVATTTTAAFTPANNCLLVALIVADANTGIVTETCAVTSTPSLPWVLSARSNGTGGSDTEVWTVPISVAQSMTISVTDNQGAVAKGVYPLWYTDSTGQAPILGKITTGAAVSTSLSLSGGASRVGSLIGEITQGVAGSVTGGGQTRIYTESGTFNGGDSINVTLKDAASTSVGQAMTITWSGTATKICMYEVVPGRVKPLNVNQTIKRAAHY